MLDLGERAQLFRLLIQDRGGKDTTVFDEVGAHRAPECLDRMVF